MREKTPKVLFVHSISCATLAIMLMAAGALAQGLADWEPITQERLQNPGNYQIIY